jgi:hypothetical protein
MARKPRPAAPDGDPKPASDDRDRLTRGNVSEVQDPRISGDGGKTDVSPSAYEPAVDAAGQIRKKDKPVDLLH